jgi:hypothetical protein
VGTGALLVLGLLVGLIGLAPAAHAHHAYVQAGLSAECLPSGAIRVSFQVSSWARADSGQHVLNPSIGIQYRTNATNGFPGEVLTGLSGDVATGSFTDNKSGGVPSFSGTFDLPASEGGRYLQVRAYPKGSWSGTGGGSTGANPTGDDSFVVAPQALPSGCVPDPTPSATASVDCAAGAVDLALTGAGSATTVDVRVDGELVGTDVAVPVGSTTFSFPLADGDENQTLTLDLDYAEGTDQQLLVPVDCDDPAAPSAGAQLDCAAGAVLVSLANAGDEATTAVISKGGVQQGGTITVPAGGVAPIPVPLVPADEDTSVALVVTFGTGLVVPLSVPVDCAQPAADLVSVAQVCAADGGSVVLTFVNPGVQDHVVSVAGAEVVVPAGATGFTHVVELPEGPYAFDVVIDDVVEPVTGTIDCQQARVVSFDEVCAEGGVVVSFANPGAQDASVSVDGVAVTVPAGATAFEVVVEAAEGSAYGFPVVVEGVSQTVAGTYDCEQADLVSVAQVCAADGGSVVLTFVNPGAQDHVVSVAGAEVVVPAGATGFTHVVELPEGPYAFDVVIDDVVEPVTGTIDCQQARVVSFDEVCAEGGVVVSFANPGAQDASVSVDGVAVTVPAGATAFEVLVDRGEGAYSVSVVIEGASQTLVGSSDCEQPAVEAISFECAEGGVVVVLSNAGASDADVTIDGAIVTVPAGAVAFEHVVAVAEGAPYAVTVVGEGVDRVLEGVRDCERVAVGAVRIECAEGGVVVVLTSSGQLPTVVTVAGVAHEVPAGAGAHEVLVPVEEDSTYSFLVEGDGIEQLVEGTYDCDLPAPSVDGDLACATGGLSLVLRNAGADEASFSVRSPALPGGVIDTVVAAGGTEAVLIPLAEDAATLVTVTSADEVLLDATVTRDCEQVQGTTVPPSSTSLPRTGSDAGRLVGFAGALLLAGLALVATGARRRVELA